MDDDFFIGTKESYMALWRSISSAFFGVFIMVSAISVVIGGIVIMNVMLVSVTLLRREIGVRRAVGATKQDILRQFMVESVMQCIAGGLAGVTLTLSGTATFTAPYGYATIEGGTVSLTKTAKVSIDDTYIDGGVTFKNAGALDDNLYVYGELSAGIPSTPVSISGHLGYTDGALSPKFATGQTVNFCDTSQCEMCFTGLYKYPANTTGGLLGCVDR